MPEVPTRHRRRPPFRFQRARASELRRRLELNAYPIALPPARPTFMVTEIAPLYCVGSLRHRLLEPEARQFGDTLRRIAARDGTFPAEPRAIGALFRSLELQPPSGYTKCFEWLVEAGEIEFLDKRRARFIEIDQPTDDVR